MSYSIDILSNWCVTTGLSRYSDLVTPFTVSLPLMTSFLAQIALIKLLQSSLCLFNHFPEKRKKGRREREGEGGKERWREEGRKEVELSFFC
jgi:hypothetical protein